MPKKSIIGFTLIEVLVSLMLLSLILFALEAMEIVSICENQASYFLSLATVRLQSMTEKLRIIKHESVLALQMAKWNEENQQVLPNGHGVIQGTYPDYTVIIYWGEKVSSCEYIQLGQSGCLKVDVKLAESL